MSTYNRGDHIFIPFYITRGEAVPDRHHGPRMYKTVEAFNKFFGEREGIELVEYAPVLEANWIDVTKPGQVTCGGNPVYACGNCGKVYGSHEFFPSAKYCSTCGARMKGCKF